MNTTAGGSPGSWREVRAFLAVELELNDEWQSAATLRLFRIGQWLYRTRTDSTVHRIGWKFWVVAERLWFHALLGSDLPAALEIGLGVRFAHGGRGVVFHPRVRFGQRCTIYHRVTAGLRGTSDDVPAFGDDVTLGTGCVVLGGVTVGDGAAIGPNAVVLHDVVDHGHAVAARLIVLDSPVDLADERATATGRLIPRSWSSS